MNIHHLELFYYVAKHGGIMGAVRNMPYGIQQPAVSGQVIQLEDDLGVKLFQRRPFALSPAGQRLYDSIRPFFDDIEGICDQIRDGNSELIRLGAPKTVLDRYFPAIVREVHESWPTVKLALREGHYTRIHELLVSDEIDLAITPIEDAIPEGFQQVSLMKIELNLLVPKRSKIKTADHFWQQDRIAEPLISLPAGEIVTKRFQSFLEGRELSWPPLIELSSLELIESYVASGLGIGLGIQKLSDENTQTVRHLSIEGIEPITIGAIWKNQLSTAGEQVVALCREKAKSLSER